ncbi:hypothetical protein MRX96_036795 [Rhipicephalus microplus]
MLSSCFCGSGSSRELPKHTTSTSHGDTTDESDGGGRATCSSFVLSVLPAEEAFLLLISVTRLLRPIQSATSSRRQGSASSLDGSNAASLSPRVASLPFGSSTEDPIYCSALRRAALHDLHSAVLE